MNDIIQFTPLFHLVGGKDCSIIEVKIISGISSDAPKSLQYHWLKIAQNKVFKFQFKSMNKTNSIQKRTFENNHSIEWDDETGIGIYKSGVVGQEDAADVRVNNADLDPETNKLIVTYLTAFIESSSTSPSTLATPATPATITTQQINKDLKNTTPISERANSLTSSLDSSTGEGIVRILRTSDAQMFAGYDVFPSLADDSIRFTLDRGAMAAAEVLSHPEGIVIISGSGTSGRLAFMVSTMLNKTVLKYTNRGNNTNNINGGPFYYCNSGGDSALLLPSELAEDNTMKGVSDLTDVITKANAIGAPVMVIGITCGMSAPYVAGQLDYVLSQIQNNDTSMGIFKACLIGFNPTSMARNIPIEMWSKRNKDEPHTFRDIALALEKGAFQDTSESTNHILINPVVGPESLCGSTRMKGGSVTKICLETMLSLALTKVYGSSMKVKENDERKEQQHKTSKDILSSFYDAFKSSYSQTKTLGHAVELVGKSLKSKGNVYYLGCGVASMVGFIDASEMRPTFGAPASETRAFALNGWSSLGNIDGDLTNMGPLYNIHFNEFNSDVIPLLSSNDVVVALHCPNENHNDNISVDQLVLKASSTSGCRTIRLAITHEASSKATKTSLLDHFTVSVLMTTNGKDKNELLPGYDAYGAFGLKIALNALSTGGQALAGRVLSNRMINVTPSNHKLFLRCTGLVSLLSGGMSEEKSRRCLLRAIYNVDEDTKVDKLLSLPVSDYIKAAGAAGSIKESNKLLPIAILLASGGDNCNTVDQAKTLLSEFGTVREALSSLNI